MELFIVYDTHLNTYMTKMVFLTILYCQVEYIDLKEETMLKIPGYAAPVQFGVLISFAYPLEGGLGEVIVATTRIETMLGDTAIAVHPEDKRYMHLHGRYAVHPFHGQRLKIICDAALVDPTFGSGAFKVRDSLVLFVYLFLVSHSWTCHIIIYYPQLTLYR